MYQKYTESNDMNKYEDRMNEMIMKAYFKKQIEVLEELAKTGKGYVFELF